MTVTLDHLTDTTTDTDDVRALFVYGTLRPSGSRSWAFERLEYDTAPADLAGWSLYGQTHAFPFAMPRPGGLVHGDVLTFSRDDFAEALEIADSIEGYPTFYDRTVVVLSTVDDDGAEHASRAWVYTPASDSLRERARRMGEITSGDWLNRR